MFLQTTTSTWNGAFSMEASAFMLLTAERYNLMLQLPDYANRLQLLGHFEHLHIGQLSCALFADSQTLITAGTDCTISIWTFTASAKSVDLQPKATLFGHRSTVTTLAVSRSYSTILSASANGRIMLWDLNRQCFLRELPRNGPVEVIFISENI